MEKRKKIETITPAHTHTNSHTYEHTRTHTLLLCNAHPPTHLVSLTPLLTVGTGTRWSCDKEMVGRPKSNTPQTQLWSSRTLTTPRPLLPTVPLRGGVVKMDGEQPTSTAAPNARARGGGDPAAQIVGDERKVERLGEEGAGREEKDDGESSPRDCSKGGSMDGKER